MIAASGCSDVYAGWVGSQSGTWDVYVTHITLNSCKVADYDGDSAVTPSDATGFASAFLAAHNSADVNFDSALDALDVTMFMQDYACGGCSQP